MCRSPLIKHTETTKKDHPVHQNVYDEPRRNTDNTKMVENIGNDLKGLTLNEMSSDPGGTTADISPSSPLGGKPGDSYDDSPNFDTNDFESGDRWFPLFSNDFQPPVDQPIVTKSDTSEIIGKPVQRRKSSNSNSSMGRYSSISGVASRSLDEPLPPIIVEDPNDAVSLKQARERVEAARKSQEQKAVEFEELEEKIEESWKAMLPKALEKAHTAVRLDNAEDFQGAWSAYRETCDWLRLIMLRTKTSEDKKKLEALVGLHQELPSTSCTDH